jgi:DUF1365 family protein
MELDINHSIGQGVIVHKRTRDTKNFFKYKAPYLCINLHQSNRVHPLISFNRFNFFSIFFKQHGYRDKKKNLITFVESVADKHQIDYQTVSFITIPSILGYSFNPISFYLFLDNNQSLKAILYEVKNTFGDQVHYLSLGDFSNKNFKKNMYVSPFIEMDCNYKISVKISEKNKFFCSINQFDNQDKQIFFASINLQLKVINMTNVIVFSLTNIFGSIKAIMLIHYQALKLWYKKSKFFKYSNAVKDNLYLD